jgi:hypothetical protein
MPDSTVEVSSSSQRTSSPIDSRESMIARVVASISGEYRRREYPDDEPGAPADLQSLARRASSAPCLATGRIARGVITLL